MAVSSAGMLVRRDLWDRLGGFAALFPGEGADTDFCWRARRAGNGWSSHLGRSSTTVVRPGPGCGRRPNCAAPAVSAPTHRGDHRLDPRAAMAPPVHRPAPPLVESCVVCSPCSAWPAPRLGRPERHHRGVVLVAVRRGRSAGRWFRQHRPVARTAPPPPHLGPASGRLAGDVPASARPRSASAVRTGHALRTTLLLVGGLALVCLLATWGLWFGDGRLLGGALQPAPDTGLDLLARFLSPWHEVGPGSPWRQRPHRPGRCRDTGLPRLGHRCPADPAAPGPRVGWARALPVTARGAAHASPGRRRRGVRLCPPR